MEDWINGLMENVDPEKAQIPIMLGEKMGQEMASTIIGHINTFMVLPENDCSIAICAYMNKALEAMTQVDSNFLDHFGPAFKSMIDSFSGGEE